LQLGDGDLAKFSVSYDGVTYDFFNLTGKTWAENRAASNGLLYGKLFGQIFLNGIASTSTFIIPSGGGQVKVALGGLEQHSVYSIEDGEEVAVETTTVVDADTQYVAHD